MSIGEPDWCFNFLVAKVLSIFGQDRWLTSSWLHLSQRKFWCTSHLGKAFVATIRFYLFVCVNVWPGRYHFSWAENLVIDEGQSPQNKIGLCRPCANLGDRSCFFSLRPKAHPFSGSFLFGNHRPLPICLAASFTPQQLARMNDKPEMFQLLCALHSCTSKARSIKLF